MNKKKLNKLALKIANDLMTARPSIPLATAIGVANYKMANICSQMRVQVDTKAGYGSTPANLYQILLLDSGGGKGASLGLVDNFYFKTAFEYMDEVVYPKYKEKGLKKLNDEGNERPLHNWVKAMSNSTTSGLYAYAESFALCGIGGINIEVDEIANAVTSKAELFEILLQPYDNGVFEPVAKRTDPDAMSVKGLSVNLYAFGNKIRLFEGDNVEQSFIRLLDEGYGRRMIFIDDKTKPKPRTADDIVREMEVSEEISTKRHEDRLMIRSLINKSNLDKVLEFDRDALVKFATIKAEGDNYIINSKGLAPAIKSDMSERNFKTAKLAGIYAFFEGSDTITGKHMEEAFEVIQDSSIVLRELRTLKSLHERLLDSMLEEENPCTSQHFLSYPFVNSTWTKKIDEFIGLAKELASEKGYIWKEASRSGVRYYSVRIEDKVLDKVDKAEAEEMSKEEKLKLLYE